MASHGFRWATPAYLLLLAWVCFWPPSRTQHRISKAKRRDSREDKLKGRKSSQRSCISHLRGGFGGLSILFATRAHFPRMAKGMNAGDFEAPESEAGDFLESGDEHQDPDIEKMKAALGDDFKLPKGAKEEENQRHEDEEISSSTSESIDGARLKEKLSFKDYEIPTEFTTPRGRAPDLAGRTLGESEIPDLPQDANTTAIQVMEETAIMREVEKELASQQLASILQHEVITIAGNAKFKYRDGDGKMARFQEPFDIACGNNGVLYVADTRGHMIRKISRAFVVSTYAGHNATGYSDGPVEKARLDLPFGLAVDMNDVVYITDTSNQKIKKVENGHIVTVAGGLPLPRDYVDGPKDEALFSYPQGLELDAANNVYVADTSHGMIRKIDLYGQVTTLVGDGIGSPCDGPMATAKLANPRSLALDHNSGRLYFTDYSDEGWSRVRMLDQNGIVSTVAGQAGFGYVDGAASLAKFGWPHGISVDLEGRVYVADTRNHVIRTISPDLKTVSTFAGSGSGGINDGLAKFSRFYYPYGVAVDDDGIVYVADTLNNRIRKIFPIVADRFVELETERRVALKRDADAKREVAQFMEDSSKAAAARIQRREEEDGMVPFDPPEDEEIDIELDDDDDDI